MIKNVHRWLQSSLRYSPKLWVLIILCTCSFFFLIFQGGKLALMLFIMISILSLYLFLGKWSGIEAAEGVRILSNEESNRQQRAGETLQVTLRVKIPGMWPVPYVVVKDRLNKRNGEEQVYESLLVPDWKRRGELTYSIQSLDRGLYHFSQTDCSTEDIFGLFEHKSQLSLPRHFSVLPQTVRIKEWILFSQMYKGLAYHSTVTRSFRETTQINGVREYIYGDRLSRIHWNATAKTGKWKSKEFERESLPKTIIVLDRNQRAYASNEEFELAVSVVASLFEYAAKRDLALGLLSIGTDVFYLDPKQSSSHHKMIENHLIDVQADGEHAISNVIQNRSRSLLQGSFLVMVSPTYGEEMLATLGWIAKRQMTPTHLWIDWQSQADCPEEWLQKMQGVGYIGYHIDSLDDLPAVLGGVNH